jgi:hypothetical protein
MKYLFIFCTPVATVSAFDCYLAIQSKPPDFLTPRGRVLFKKLWVTQLINIFSIFYRTRSFITMFTEASHLFLPCANQNS